MKYEGLIFSVGMSGLIFSLILYVIFGQTTVRKSPETKDALGLQFASGWDILNVAQALALPKYLTRKLTKSPIASFYADRELLEKHTSIFERYLALLFFWLFALPTLSILSLAFI